LQLLTHRKRTWQQLVFSFLLIRYTGMCTLPKNLDNLASSSSKLHGRILIILGSKMQNIFCTSYAHSSFSYAEAYIHFCIGLYMLYCSPPGSKSEMLGSHICGVIKASIFQANELQSFTSITWRQNCVISVDAIQKWLKLVKTKLHQNQNMHTIFKITVRLIVKLLHFLSLMICKQWSENNMLKLNNAENIWNKCIHFTRDVFKIGLAHDSIKNRQQNYV